MLFEKVLISIDFSQESELLLNCLDEFKGFGLKEVVLAHVVDIRAAGGNASDFLAPNEEKLAKIKDVLEKDGIQAKVAVNIGFPAEEISNIASQENASMILAGSHGGGFIKKLFLGSTAFDLLRITDIPLLIERFKRKKEEIEPYCELKFEKVLIATDFSGCSANLLDIVVENKKNFREMHMLHIIERAHNKKDFERLKEGAESTLKQIKDGIGPGLKIYTKIKAGDASKNILEEAQKEDISLIMLAKRGRGGTKEMLLGSTARDIAVRSTRTAVLVVPC